METHDISMEEEFGWDTSMDTQMLEAYEPSYAQRKRTWEQLSGSRKKEKAHKMPMHTSLTTQNVALITMIVEDQLPEVWESVENHKDSILEQV